MNRKLQKRVKLKNSGEVILQNNKLQQAKDYVFKLLSYRDRSEYEIVNRLKEKGYEEDIINEVLSVLYRLDYIDDNRFTHKWVKDRIKNKPRGPHLIRSELSKKGIKNSIIENVLNKYFTEETEYKIAKKLADKWLRINNDKKDYLLKLKRYLHNKGISDYIIRKHF